MSLTLTAAPAVEPISLAEAKAHLRAEGAAEDAFISSLIVTSRLQVEAILGLALIAQSWSWRLDAWPAGTVTLPLRPVIAVDLVGIRNADLTTTTVPPTAYILDGDAAPARLVPTGSGLPRPGVAALGCDVEFTAGFGTSATDVPASLRQAILLLVAHWYENREPIVAGAPVTKFPDAVIGLLEPYRVCRL